MSIALYSHSREGDQQLDPAPWFISLPGTSIKVNEADGCDSRFHPGTRSQEPLFVVVTLFVVGAEIVTTGSSGEINSRAALPNSASAPRSQIGIFAREKSFINYRHEKSRQQFNTLEI